MDKNKSSCDLLLRLKVEKRDGDEITRIGITSVKDEGKSVGKQSCRGGTCARRR